MLIGANALSEQPISAFADNFGQCTAALSTFACSLTGLVTFTGTLSAAMQPFDMSATGINLSPVTGTLDVAMSPFAMSATGTVLLAITGTLTAACSPFASTATGAQTFAGTCSAAMKPFATQPSAGITVIQNTAVGSDGAGQSATYNAASTFTAGSTVFLIINSWPNPTYTSVTIDGVAATKDLSANAGADTCAIWRADNVPGSGTAVVTVSGVGTCDYTTGAIIEVAGLQSSPLDQTGTATGTSTAPAATASGANTLADEFVITLWSNSTNDTGYTALPGGYTASFTGRASGEGGSGAYKITSALETSSATWTAFSSVAWACIIASYKGAPTTNLIQTFTGSCAAARVPFAFAATGAETFTGTMAAACSPFAFAATGAETFTGTCAAAMSPFAFTATGAETFSGTLTAATSPFAFDATGAETFTGAASMACSPFALTAAGAVSLNVIGTLDASTSPFACTLVGQQVFAGSLTVAAMPFAFDATGAETFIGLMVASVSTFQIDALGRIDILGTLTAAASSFAFDAIGITGSQPPPFCVGLAEIKFVVSLVDTIENFALAVPVVMLAQTTSTSSVALALNEPLVAEVDAPQTRTIVFSC